MTRYIRLQLAQGVRDSPENETEDHGGCENGFQIDFDYESGVNPVEDCETDLE